jgi:hypothetical protein
MGKSITFVAQKRWEVILILISGFLAWIWHFTHPILAILIIVSCVSFIVHDSRTLKRGLNYILRFINDFRLEFILGIIFMILDFFWNFNIYIMTGTFILFVFLITIKNTNSLESFFSLISRDVFNNYRKSILILMVIILMAIWNINLPLIIFSAALLAFIFYSWNGKIAALLSLGFLGCCFVFFIMSMNTNAETTALYAYYCFLIALIVRLFETVSAKYEN